MLRRIPVLVMLALSLAACGRFRFTTVDAGIDAALVEADAFEPDAARDAGVALDARIRMDADLDAALPLDADLDAWSLPDAGTDAAVAFPDASSDAARLPDAWAPDAWEPDAWEPDAWAPDAWAPDAWAPDAWEPPDAWAPDAPFIDAWAPDAWAPDAWAPDAWAPDAWAPDAWAPDAWEPDAWAPDAASSCTTDGVGFAGGGGVAGDPYLICDCRQLENIDRFPNAAYRLISDIDCGASAGWDSGRGFRPIRRFSGLLDGDYHVITDLTISRGGSDNVGLVGQLSNSGAIERLGLVNARIQGKDFVGAVVGYATEPIWGARLRVSTVFAESSEVRGGNYVGGLVGNEFGAGLRITDSYFCGSVDGATDYTGGLVSTMYTGPPGGGAAGGIFNGYACGSVRGPRAAGAFTYAWETDLVGVFSTVPDLPVCLGVFGDGRARDTYYTSGGPRGGCGTEVGDPGEFSDVGHPVYATWDFTSVWVMGPGGRPLLRGFSTTP